MYIVNHPVVRMMRKRKFILLAGSLVAFVLDGIQRLTFLEGHFNLGLVLRVTGGLEWA